MLTLHVGKFCLKLRLLLVKLNLKISIIYVENQMKIIIKIIFYNNLKENAET
jgi:hypothetical protein